MFAVQPRGSFECDEELRSISAKRRLVRNSRTIGDKGERLRVLPGVGHRQEARFCMFLYEILIREFAPLCGLAACSLYIQFISMSPEININALAIGIVCDNYMQQKEIGMGPYIATSEIASLNHEIRNDSMEDAPGVTFPGLTFAKSSKICRGFRNYVVVEVKLNSAS